MSGTRVFLQDESGAVTVDWVAITAGIIILGIAVVFSIFNGAAPIIFNVADTLSSHGNDVVLPETPVID